jgi:hypothetical protein
MLGVLVMIHEFGHFAAARLCGIEVKEFSIGFGKKLWGRVGRRGTQFSLRLVPLGGYCMFYGDTDDDPEGKTKDDPRNFTATAVWKRMLVTVAGPLMNAVLALALSVVLMGFWGAEIDTPFLYEVTGGSPAYEAGLRPGDVFVSIGDTDLTAATAQDGTATFSALETGLYLVGQVAAGKDYQFERFMVYLPTPTNEGYQYDVSAKPKSSLLPSLMEYTVLKLWQDSGNRDQRPASVTVDILKDGLLQETVTLSSANNWSYTWKVPGGDTGKWTVSETDVPDHYRVAITENGASFLITNTCTAAPSAPPQTGDSFPLMSWVMAMCLSGCFLVILGIYSWRRRG